MLPARSKRHAVPENTAGEAAAGREDAGAAAARHAVPDHGVHALRVEGFSSRNAAGRRRRLQLRALVLLPLLLVPVQIEFSFLFFFHWCSVELRDEDIVILIEFFLMCMRRMVYD